MAKIAIVGAGLAAASLWRVLRGQHHIEIFEKSRGLGGRLATRRQDGVQFNHGAQFLTARSKEFLDFLGECAAIEWKPRITTLSQDRQPYKRDWFEPHWVGTPSMSALLKPVFDQCPLELGRRIERLEKTSQGWQLQGEGWNSSDFDAVVMTCPAEQASALLPASFEGRGLLDQVRMLPCFALMACLTRGCVVPSWQAAAIQAQVLQWASFGESTLLLHSCNQWAQHNLELPLEQVQSLMLEEFSELSGLSLQYSQVAVHRWRYALVEQPLNSSSPFLWDGSLGVAGDWCVGPRGESAFLSGHALGQQILQDLPV